MRSGRHAGACKFGVSERQHLRLRLEKRRQVKAEGAKAHAERLEGPALVAAEQPDARVGRAPIQDPELLDELVGEAAREPPQPPVLDRLLEVLQRVKTPARLGGHESFEAPRGALALRLGAELADESHPRRERLAGDDLARRFAPPVDDAARRKPKGLVALARQRAKPTGDLGRDDPLDRAA